MAEGNEQRKPMEEKPNGGEAGENESQHGGEEAIWEETNGAEEEEARREANLKWKIAGCTGNGGKRRKKKAGTEEKERLFLKNILSSVF